jgi:UDP:flavonoid glycosyltransferase YjiC (YdhE family)
VTVETFERWRELIGELGLGFLPAAESIAEDERGGGPEPTLAEAARDLAAEYREHSPDVLVHDMWTLAPAFAADVAEVPRATLVPHPYPVHGPGLPFYPLGLGPPRTGAGRRLWDALWPGVGTRLPNTRLRAVRARLDATRARLGLDPLPGYDGQISPRLGLVATFPQLEYPRAWPTTVHVPGPMPFERPHPGGELPSGEPLVLVAASTERDPEQRLASAALEALAAEPVQVLVALNRPGERWRGPVPPNATIADWVSYSRAMPRAAAVICHGGHGTIARALAAGAPVLVSPMAGDQAENGARVAWAGAGLMLPRRLLGAGALRSATRALLGEPRFAARAGELARWSAEHDGAATGARLVEELGSGR